MIIVLGGILRGGDDGGHRGGSGDGMVGGLFCQLPFFVVVVVAVGVSRWDRGRIYFPFAGCRYTVLVGYHGRRGRWGRRSPELRGIPPGLRGEVGWGRVIPAWGRVPSRQMEGAERGCLESR